MATEMYFDDDAVLDFINSLPYENVRTGILKGMDSTGNEDATVVLRYHRQELNEVTYYVLFKSVNVSDGGLFMIVSDSINEIISLLITVLNQLPFSAQTEFGHKIELIQARLLELDRDK